jgi:hypothetical protein
MLRYATSAEELAAFSVCNDARAITVGIRPDYVAKVAAWTLNAAMDAV